MFHPETSFETLPFERENGAYQTLSNEQGEDGLHDEEQGDTPQDVHEGANDALHHQTEFRKEAEGALSPFDLFESLAFTYTCKDL